MSEKDDGGAAFPGRSAYRDSAQGGYTFAVDGMSLRDWLAGHALAGMLSDVGNITAMLGESKRRDVAIAVICAENSYAAADAMLEARK